MKNAILYKDSWLMPNSLAQELYKEWAKASGENKSLAKKKLESHCKEVDIAYKKQCGLSVSG